MKFQRKQHEQSKETKKENLKDIDPELIFEVYKNKIRILRSRSNRHAYISQCAQRISGQYGPKTRNIVSYIAKFQVLESRPWPSKRTTLPGPGYGYKYLTNLTYISKCIAKYSYMPKLGSTDVYVYEYLELSHRGRNMWTSPYVRGILIPVPVPTVPRAHEPTNRKNPIPE